MGTKKPGVKAPGPDWAALYEIVNADSAEAARRFGIDFDEHYVDALERAIDRHDPRRLLALLDEKRLMHPLLGPVLAGYLRNKHGGSPKLLTTGDDANVRRLYDGFTANRRGQSLKTKDWIAGLFHVSRDTIELSLKRTAKPRGSVP